MKIEIEQDDLEKLVLGYRELWYGLEACIDYEKANPDFVKGIVWWKNTIPELEKKCQIFVTITGPKQSKVSERMGLEPTIS